MPTLDMTISLIKPGETYPPSLITYRFLRRKR